MKQRIRYQLIGIVAAFLCMTALLTNCEDSIAVQKDGETFSEASAETQQEASAKIPEEEESASYIFSKEAFQNPDTLLSEINNHAGHVDTLLTLNRSFLQTMLDAAASENTNRYNNEYWRSVFAVDYSENVTCQLAERIDVNGDGPIGCIVHLLCWHLDIYLLYTRNLDSNTDEYTLSGLVLTNERNTSDYRDCRVDRVEAYDNQFWIVVQVETDHGTGVTCFNEIWYDHTGKEALCIQNKGSADLFNVQYQDSWYSGGVNFDSVIEKQEDDTAFTVTAKLAADFTYMQKTAFHSDEVLVYRYDAETKSFNHVPEKSTLQPSLYIREPKGYKADNSLLNKYDYRYDYDKAEPPPDEDEWVKIIKSKANPERSPLSNLRQV